MKDQTIYAVVDIETTGTNTEKDKIIQFACVLVQNRKIINHFSTDVNPLQSIPKNIEYLTGITNQQVASAPYFEDIAPIIKELLNDCVFVAHNVYFDFAFLNSELTRSGEKALTAACVDTVELAQILSPQATGFRVTDLAAHFDLAHDNPHQALSDAYVTAEIFIELVKKIDEIPYVTLAKMTELSKFLGVNNDLIFEKALAKKDKNLLNQLLDYVKTIDMITLKIKNYQFKEINHHRKLKYPSEETLKEQLLDSGLTYREEQKQMMDRIYEFTTNDTKSKNLLVESSTGTGKSLGYLLPIIYSNKGKVIISTSTIMLQEQLMYRSIPQLEKIVNSDINAVILKSSSHFIDLDKFYKTLIAEPNHQKQYIINQMAVLNWLRETETGDLDELNLNKKHLFFEHIGHHGIHTLNKSSLFYEEDFLCFLEEKKNQADVLIVNHSFLCEETYRETKLLPKTNILVVDEAHKLIHTLEEKNLTQLSFKYLYKLLRQIKEIEDLKDCLTEKNDETLQKSVELLSLLSVDAKEDIQWLETFLMQFGKLTEHSPERNLKDLGLVSEWPTAMKKNMKELMIIFREMNQLIKQATAELSMRKNLTTDNEYFLLLEYANTLTSLKEFTTSFINFFKVEDIEFTRLISLERQHLCLKEINFKQVSIQETSWYQNFEKIIFTSGTLQLNIDSDYFEEQLDLPTPEKFILREKYSYQDNAELLVIKDYENQDFGNEKNYVNFITKSIVEMYQVKQSSMLVLFTSHRILQKVYKELVHKIRFEETEIFVQGITGTKEKIIKRFIKNNGGIILGANSFWEGVDMNLPKLDLIMMTKLPFDPPNRPLIEAKYRFLEQEGKNPFYDEAIPQAGNRLRQGIGRLIRSEEDKGIIAVLDYRLLGSSYSKELLNYLPKDLTVKNCYLNEALTEINTFFTEK